MFAIILRLGFIAVVLLIQGCSSQSLVSGQPDQAIARQDGIAIQMVSVNGIYGGELSGTLTITNTTKETIKYNKTDLYGYLLRGIWIDSQGTEYSASFASYPVRFLPYWKRQPDDVLLAFESRLIEIQTSGNARMVNRDQVLPLKGTWLRLKELPELKEIPVHGSVQVKE